MSHGFRSGSWVLVGQGKASRRAERRAELGGRSSATRGGGAARAPARASAPEVIGSPPTRRGSAQSKCSRWRRHRYRFASGGMRRDAAGCGGRRSSGPGSVFARNAMATGAELADGVQVLEDQVGGWSLSAFLATGMPRPLSRTDRLLSLGRFRRTDFRISFARRRLVVLLSQPPDLLALLAAQQLGARAAGPQIR